tara:strand:- start:212 stop:589 length:378 start_codon:yes stop_codon:yes gene_type:complete
MTYIIIFLTISVFLNVFLIFYLRWLLKNFTFLSENIYNLLETVQSFSDHLGAVNELETFYGDKTLQNLLTHAKQVTEEIKQYKEIYTLTHDEEEVGDIFYGTEAETESETEEEEEDQEAILHTGS